MARARLSDVWIHGKLKERIRRDGTCYVYLPGTTTAAVVYAASSAATAITQPVPYVESRDALLGWVDAGEYDLFQGGKTQSVEAQAGDSATVTPASVDPQNSGDLSTANIPWRDINSLASTNVSQTIKFVRIVPLVTIAAGVVITNSGSTAAA